MAGCTAHYFNHMEKSQLETHEAAKLALEEIEYAHKKGTMPDEAYNDAKKHLEELRDGSVSVH